MATQTILLVDQHEDSRLIYRAILRYHGYETLEAGDADTGSRLAREYAPDLLVLGTFLPEDDDAAVRGWPLYRATAEDPPLLLMTAHPLGERQRLALRGRCAAHLVKPCPPSRLLTEVQRLLQRRHTA